MSHEISNTSPLMNIDVPRLFTELALTDADRLQLSALPIPNDVRVPSLSPIKINTVTDVLHIIKPEETFMVIGVKAPSDVAEQPLGQTTIDGALNRLRNGITLREQLIPGEADSTGWFSIENGLFRNGHEQPQTKPSGKGVESLVQATASADLTTEFDPAANYEDRAVTVIRIPGYPTIVEISPPTEAVAFPQSAVHAAYNAAGGFEVWTAGSKLSEMGIVHDKQNPHTELTTHRLGGPLPRQDQMARVMIRGLLRLAREV